MPSIKEVKVTVGFADKNGQPALVMTRDDNQNFNFVQWLMHRHESAGYVALCQNLGDTVLRMLALAHSAEFAKTPALVPPRQDVSEPYGLVHALMHRSYKEQTTDYVQTIDLLMEKNADELSDTELPEIWQAARLQLIEIFPPK
ncbi:hypothetical protein [Massilia sp. TWR1-2-2]|uniref:hypothetical protein n=1 Tax=Massilia sp. TWR1-2-2 TaxID=2804584 RepID=UPI003CE68F98